MGNTSSGMRQIEIEHTTSAIGHVVLLWVHLLAS